VAALPLTIGFARPSKRVTHPEMDTIAYKIETEDVWADAQRAGVYLGSALDKTDGFIHLSSRAQTRETAAKWFAGQTGLVLLRVELTPLGDAVRWEASRGGDLFPHIYGALPTLAVSAMWVIPVGADGAHIMPDEIA
jgi:uncharacterized protein (DUF952 family)